MNHAMKITLTKDVPDDPLFAIKTLSIGIRLWKRLFGRRKLVILVPGGTVETVTITEKGMTSNHDSS